MVENTKIADHVWDPWIVNGDVRRKTSYSYWQNPIKWNLQAMVDRRVVEHLLVTARQSAGEIAGILDLPLGLVDASLKRLAKPGRAMEFVRFSPKPKGRHLAYQLTSRAESFPIRSGDRPKWIHPRVFCGSLCDVFEDWKGPIVDAKGKRLSLHKADMNPPHNYIPVREMDIAPAPGRWATMSDIRRDLFDQIDQCQNLDWLLLTKRPKYILPMWIPPHDGSVQCLVCQKIWANTEAYKCPDCGQDDSREMTHIISEHRKNVWLLYSASAQDTLEAGIGHLLECRDLTPTLGLSLEPLVGPIDLSKYLDKLDFVIVGGESGPNARPCDLAWILDIVQQCEAAGVPCFVKQWGANPIASCDLINRLIAYSIWDNPPEGVRVTPDTQRLTLKHPKGGDMSEWPESIRVQQIPEVKLC